MKQHRERSNEKNSNESAVAPTLYGSTTVARDLKVDPSAPPAFQDEATATATATTAFAFATRIEEAAADPRNYRAPAFQKLRRDDDVEIGDGDGNGNGNDNRNNEDDEKVCRICLEEDSPETMIAPCRCKGTSRWVHRECLDEWRTNERDRAFSKCTECRFEYYLQPVYQDEGEDEDDNNGCGNNNPACGPGCNREQRRRCHFCGMVSRDVCAGVVLQQLIVGMLGGILWLCDPDLGPLLLYYGLGWFVFLIGLGLYGLIVLCANRCNLKRAIPRVGPPSEAEAEAEAEPTSDELPRDDYQTGRNRDGNHYYYGYPSQSPTHGYHYTRCDDDDDYDHSRSRYSSHPPRHRDCRYTEQPSVQFYRRARRRHGYYRRRHWYDNDDDDYYHRYRYPYYYGPTYYPMYVYPTGNHCCCCCCCCDSHGPPVNVDSVGGSGCCDCDLGGCLGVFHRHASSASLGGFGGSSGSSNSSNSNNNSNSNSNSDHHQFREVILAVLLVVAIVLAVIGFFVGVVVVVIAAQRIVARHVHLLQKRQLVREFRVLDLQEYDLDAPTATAPTEDEVVSGSGGAGVGVNVGVNVKHPPPSAPVLEVNDAVYLQNLGLMDRR
eukprot:jgi/Psemu1/26862/gm1.26862_g